MCQARAKLYKYLIIKCLYLIYQAISVSKPDTGPDSVLKTTKKMAKVQIFSLAPAIPSKNVRK